MQENWPKIKFHPLREHAGPVFQKGLEGKRLHKQPSAVLRRHKRNFTRKG